MVGMCCSVCHCSNNYEKCHGTEISFHRFPKDIQIRKQWLTLCKKSFNPDKSYICSEHFEYCDFERDFRSELMGCSRKRRLKKGAIPKLKLPQYAQAHKLSDSIQPAGTIDQEFVEGNESSLQADISEEISTIQVNNKIDYEELSQLYETCREENANLKQKLRKAQVAKNNIRKDLWKLRREKKIPKLRQLLKQYQLMKLHIKKLKEEVKSLTCKQSNNAKLNINNVIIPNETKQQKQVKLHWSIQKISQAFSLFYLGNTAHNYLQGTTEYPLQGLSFEELPMNISMEYGIIKEVVKIMDIVGQDLNNVSKLTVLMFGEMVLESLVEHDFSEDVIIAPFSHMQIIMARGLCSNWKQPIYFGFNKKITREVLFDIIKSLNQISYTVVAVVSDLGMENVCLMRDLGITCEKPYFKCNFLNNEIAYFIDASHLLKLIRNWFLDTSFILNNRKISVKPIVKLLSVTSEQSVSTKLTEEHLKCKGSKRECVTLAAQLFSHTTATALKHCLLYEEAIDTALFIQTVSSWFNIMNVCVSEGFENTYSGLYGFSDSVSKQNTDLDKMYQTILMMRCQGKSNLQLFQKGILISINSLKFLHQYLSDNFNVSCITTAKLNHDPLETFFTQLKSTVGVNDCPSPLNSLYKLKRILLGETDNANFINNHEEYIITNIIKLLNLKVKTN